MRRQYRARVEEGTARQGPAEQGAAARRVRRGGQKGQCEHGGARARARRLRLDGTASLRAREKRGRKDGRWRGHIVGSVVPQGAVLWYKARRGGGGGPKGRWARSEGSLCRLPSRRGAAAPAAWPWLRAGDAACRLSGSRARRPLDRLLTASARVAGPAAPPPAPAGQACASGRSAAPAGAARSR